MLTSDWTAFPNGRVRAQVRNRVAWIEMRHPPANNYSYELMRDLDEAILSARMDDGVDVLVIGGDGDKFFSSGADIRMLSTVTPRYKYYFCLHANETLLRLGSTPKLSIAALNGHCVGGGLEIALACDLRLARRNALAQKEFRIGLPEVTLGVLPGTGGTQRLSRLIGGAKALELMAEGSLMSPDEAKAAGLVHKVFDFDGFRDAVQAYAERFTAPHKAAFAVGAIKRAVQSGSDLPLEAGLALERELQQQLFQSRDAKEGLTAFEEKRKPAFEGC